MAASGASTPRAGPASGELRALLRLAGPLVGGNLLQMAIYSVDVLFVARLGQRSFAAATLGVYLYSLALFALTGLVGAAAPLIAAELGRRRHAVREVRRSVRMALWLAVAAGAPAMAVLWHGGLILRWAGQDAEVARLGGAFGRVLLWSLIPALAAAILRQAAAALGRPGYALLINGGAVGVSLLANWCFVWGHGGAPALGLEGSALASALTSAAILLAYLLAFRLDPRLRRWRLFGRWWRADPPRLAEIARLGGPMALTTLFEAGLFGGAGLLMGLIGVTAVAAHAVAINIAAFTFQVALGVGQAATIRVGLAHGARDRAGVARAGWTALAVGMGFMGVCALALASAPRLFAGIYLDASDPANAPALALAARFLLFAAAFQLFDGAQAVGAGVLRGVQDTRAPMWIALAGYWIAGFGTAVGLGFGAGWGGTGIWAGLTVGLVAVAAALVTRWARREALGLA